MKKFVIALLCVIALCGVAAADIVYSTLKAFSTRQALRSQQWAHIGTMKL